LYWNQTFKKVGQHSIDMSQKAHNARQVFKVFRSAAVTSNIKYISNLFILYK